MENGKPIGGSVFVFGEQPGGFAARFERLSDGKIVGTVTIDPAKQGPPAHAHGGSLATLIDEAMGASCWTQGHQVLAANLNINYKFPVPLNTQVTVTGEIERIEGRKIFTNGAIILPDGRVATTGTGLFSIAPDLFEKNQDNPFMLDAKE